MKVSRLVVLLVAALVLSGCAAEPTAASGNGDAGFLLGWWHGVIVVPAFFASLVWDSVAVYDAANTGWPYDLGFVIGIGGVTAMASEGRR